MNLQTKRWCQTTSVCHASTWDFWRSYSSSDKIKPNGNSRKYIYAQVITEDGSANGVWDKVVEAQKQSQQKLSQPATLDLIVSELQSQVTHAAMQPLAKTRTLEGMSGIDRWFWVPCFLALLLTSNRYESWANNKNGGILLQSWNFVFVEGRRPIACDI